MRVVVAPDSFGGTLSAGEVAEAIAAGWRQERPGDELVVLPLSDGGEGLLEVVAAGTDRWETVEVAGPQATPVQARFLLRPDASAVVEAAEACGLHLVDADRRNPVITTTYGVGQLLEAARQAGARHVAVGVGGSATVDGGAGALLALGFRLRRRNGHGLKVGGGELVDVSDAAPQWVDPAWGDIDVEVWADVRTPLEQAAATYGPQKGADAQGVAFLERGLRRWAEVATRDLGPDCPDPAAPHTGAAGGLAFGLAAGVGARLVDGAAAVAAAVGLGAALDGAAAVVTGEGRLDATSHEGKVVGHVARQAEAAGIPALAVVGRREDGGGGLADVEQASPGGPGEDPARDVAAAAARIAARFGR